MLCAVARTGLYSCYMILAIVFENGSANIQIYFFLTK